MNPAAAGPPEPHAGAERDLSARARRAVSAAGIVEPPPASPALEDAQARAVLDDLARAGLLDRLMPPESRSDATKAPVSVREVCIIREELASVSGLADVMFVMQGLGSCAIMLAGSEALKSRFLPGVARGERIAAFAMTEPDAGSDVGSIRTRAVRRGGDYLLDGVKTFISNAGLADVYTVFARTGEPGRRGLSAFVVEKTAPGFAVTERITVSAPHPIGTVCFSACRVPVSQRLGSEGEGFDLAMRVLERFRPTVGAAAAGIARRALEESLERCRVREQFGRAIGRFQAIRFKLADMAVSLDAARLLVMRAATMIDDSRDESAGGTTRRRASAMAKLFATEAAQRIVDEAVQIHGALGVTRGHVIERLYREIRAMRIYEGTSEIQRAIIARTLLAD